MNRTFETIVIDKLGEISMILNEHTQRFEKIETTLAEHTEHFKEIDATLAEHSAILKEHSKNFEKIDATLAEHSEKFERNHNDLMTLFNYISDVDEHYHSRLKKLK